MAKSFLVAGLAFGDEGKGACVDALTRHFPVDLIVRYNGGCQAAHNVVTPEGIHHTFSQFGSGMLANDRVRTHLSKHMLVEPLSMIREATALEKLTPNVWERTTVAADAVITTPLHSQLNRLREMDRGADRHGSCGRGIGLTRELHLKYGPLVPFASDFSNKKMLADKIHWLHETLLKETTELAQGRIANERLWTADNLLEEYEMMAWPATIVEDFEPAELMVFEGAQGALLDEKFGFAPHNTWTDTTYNNADDLLDEVGCSERIRIGCIRTYYTRHGAGPLRTEDASLNIPEPHNRGDGFQGAFRQGWFDWELFKSALTIMDGVDYVALSHIDVIPALKMTTHEIAGFINNLCPIGMRADGPTHEHREITIKEL